MKTPRVGNRFLSGFVFLVALAMVAGCNFPGVVPKTDDLATAAAETVAAHLTLPVIDGVPTATATPEIPPITAVTPEMTASLTATVRTPSPTPTNGACTNQAVFINDVTIPDDTFMSPGAAFVKTWRLRNAGTCTWTTGYTLVFAGSGHIMGGPATGVPLPGVVPPGATVDLSVGLTAPAANGEYRGDWQLRSEEGQTFGLGPRGGQTFWVQIIVGSTPTPTATATATLSPTPTETASPTPTATP